MSGRSFNRAVARKAADLPGVKPRDLLSSLRWQPRSWDCVSPWGAARPLGFGNCGHLVTKCWYAEFWREACCGGRFAPAPHRALRGIALALHGPMR